MPTPTPQLSGTIQVHCIFGLLCTQGQLRLAETLTLHQLNTGETLDLTDNPNPALPCTVWSRAS